MKQNQTKIKSSRSKSKVRKGLIKTFRTLSRRQLLIFMILFAVVGSVFLYLAFAGTLSSTDEQDQINRINTYRSQKGSASLTLSYCLTNAARAWSQEMSRGGTLRHSDTQNLVATHCPTTQPNWTILGENVGVGGSSQSIFEAFIRSAGHEANISKSEYNLLGVGVYKEDNGALWITQLFAKCDGCAGAWTQGSAAVTATSSKSIPTGVGVAAKRDLTGHWSVGSNGQVTPFGSARHFGDMYGQALNKPIVGMAATPSGNGYWLVASDGGIFSFGDAGFHGSTGGMTLNAPIVGIAAHPNGQGYWLVAADGGIFSFGSVGYFGSLGGQALNKPVIGMTSSPSGNGYWLYAADGGIFTFGDAGFFGSTGDRALNQPIVAMAAHPSNNGYWLVAKDGGIFAFGGAGFFGSAGGSGLTKAIIGMVVSSDGNGYSLIQSDGTAIPYGSAQKVYGVTVYRDTTLIPSVLEGENFSGNCATSLMAVEGASYGLVKFMNAESDCGSIPSASTTHNGSISSLSIRYQCYAGYDNAWVNVKIDGNDVINGQTECRNGFIKISRSGLNYSSGTHSIEVRNNISVAYGFMLFDYIETVAVPYTNSPPSAPGNLKITGDSGAGRIGLIWDASTDNKGVTGYRIYRNGALLATATQTSYTDLSVVGSTAYTYRVSAIDTEQAESSLSNSVSFTTPYVNTPPSSPSNLKTTSVQSRSVSISWTASVDNRGIKEYRVFRDGKQIGVTGSTTYTDNNVRRGAKYTYEVLAVDTEGALSVKSPKLIVTVPKK